MSATCPIANTLLTRGPRVSSQDLRFDKTVALIAACLAALSCGEAGSVSEPAAGAAGVSGQAAGSGVSPAVQLGVAGAGTGQVSAGSAAGVSAPRAGTGFAAGSGGSGAGASAFAGAGGNVASSAGAGGIGGAGGAGSGAVAAAGAAASGVAGHGGRAAAGAGASGAGAAGSAAGGAGAAGSNAGEAPTFDAVYALITDSCNGCHALGDGGLTTKTRDGAYTGLVNASARQCSGWKRVVPNQPDRSVLYLAITRTSVSGCDPRDMPPGGTKWSQENIDLVKAWILAGAPNN